MLARAFKFNATFRNLSFVAFHQQTYSKSPKLWHWGGGGGICGGEILEARGEVPGRPHEILPSEGWETGKGLKSRVNEEP